MLSPLSRVLRVRQCAAALLPVCCVCLTLEARLLPAQTNDTPQPAPAAPALPESSGKATPAPAAPTDLPQLDLPQDGDPPADSTDAPAEAAPLNVPPLQPASSIVITPRPRFPHPPAYAISTPEGHAVVPPAPAAAVAGDCPNCPSPVDPRRYREIYESIPFSRAEYEANPSWRHEATMELLFGRLRPTTVHKHMAPGRPRSAALSSAAVLTEPAPRRQYRFGYYRHGYRVRTWWPSRGW